MVIRFTVRRLIIVTALFAVLLALLVALDYYWHWALSRPFHDYYFPKKSS